MKSFVTAVLAAGASARVHEYFAETNLICSICQDAVKYEANNQHEDLDNLYEMFPKLEEKIQTFQDSISEIVNLQDALGTCQRLNLCESYNMVDMIEDNEIIDLKSVSEHVNSIGANWISNPNSQFNDMTRSEIKKIMGTIVDPDWIIKEGGIQEAVGASVPTFFNSSTNWPQC